MRTSDAAPRAILPAARSAAVRRVLWITLALNLAVALAKLIAGLTTGTLSMIADGYHSLLDGAGNIVGLLALAVAHRPPDADHHYGHRKFEVVASVGISVFLFIAAAEILASSWSRLVGEDDPAIFSPISVGIMILTMVVNLGVSRYEARRGRELSSPFLLADARHTASDLYASASVLAALIGLRLGLPWVDPLAALIICGIVVHAGISILRWSLGVLADRALFAAGTIEAVALALPQVRSCPRVRTRGFADAVFVDLTVHLDPDLTLRQAHDICDGVEHRIRARFPEVTDVVVHPEPADGPTVDLLTGAGDEE